MELNSSAENDSSMEEDYCEDISVNFPFRNLTSTSTVKSYIKDQQKKNVCIIGLDLSQNQLSSISDLEGRSLF